MQRVELSKNVNLHVHPCKKFKDVTMEMNCALPIEETGATSLVLAFLLDDVCNSIRLKQEVAKICDDLYGAEFEVNEVSKGFSGILKFTIRCIDGRYVSEKDLLEKQVFLMHAFMMDPYFVDGLFYGPLFEEGKKKALTAISMALDDAPSVVLEEAMALYGSTLAKRCLPSVDDVMAVTNEDVVALYQKCMRECCIDFFVLGNVVEDEVVRLFQKMFVFEDRDASLKMYTASHKEGYVEKVMEKKLSQSSVCLLYEDGIAYTDEDVVALMLMNGMLGGLPTSLLFQVIREEKSLCYTIGSENYIYDGVIQIGYECEKKQIEPIFALVQEQIAVLQKGKFSEELFEMTKKMYKSSWRGSSDFASSMIWDDYRSRILGYEDSIETMCKKMDAVTREDVMRVSQRLVLKVKCMLVEKEEL